MARYKSSFKEDDLYTPYLMEAFEEREVKPLLTQGWVLDELAAGVSLESILDDIWEMFPQWAENYIYEEMRSYWEDYA